MNPAKQAEREGKISFELGLLCLIVYQLTSEMRWILPFSRNPPLSGLSTEGFQWITCFSPLFYFKNDQAVVHTEAGVAQAMKMDFVWPLLLSPLGIVGLLAFWCTPTELFGPNRSASLRTTPRAANHEALTVHLPIIINSA